MVLDFQTLKAKKELQGRPLRVPISGTFREENDEDNNFIYNGIPPTTTSPSLLFNQMGQFVPHKPRLLICPQTNLLPIEDTMGEDHLAMAIIHEFDSLYFQSFELASLMGDPYRTPEAVCVSLFTEVKSSSPSIIFVPNINTWWNTVSPTLKTTFISLLNSLNSEERILLFATSSTPFENLPEEIQDIFSLENHVDESLFSIPFPTLEERTAFFSDFTSTVSQIPPSTILKDGLIFKKRKAPVPKLPFAKLTPKILSPEEELKVLEEEENHLRELRFVLFIFIIYLLFSFA